VNTKEVVRAGQMCSCRYGNMKSCGLGSPGETIEAHSTS